MAIQDNVENRIGQNVDMQYVMYSTTRMILDNFKIS